MYLHVILISAVFATSSLLASVDYKYCSKFIQDTNAIGEKTNFYFPFNVSSEDGSVVTTMPNVNYDGSQKGLHRYSSSEYAGSMEVIVKKNKQSNVGSIQINKVTLVPGQAGKVQTTVKFDVKNGKCVPISAKSTFNKAGVPGEINSTIFDVPLCKQVEDFMTKNPDIAKCLDPDSKESKAMKALFAKNGYNDKQLANIFNPMTPDAGRYAYSVEQKVMTGSKELFKFMPVKAGDEKRTLGIIGGSPLISAHMILNDCYERGFQKLLQDQSVWSAPKSGTRPAAPNQATQN